MNPLLEKLEMFEEIRYLVPPVNPHDLTFAEVKALVRDVNKKLGMIKIVCDL